MWLPTIRNATASLGSHLAVVQFAFSLPIALLFMAFDYANGDLTLGRVVWIVLVWSAAGVIVGVVGWYVILSPFLRKRGKLR